MIIVVPVNPSCSCLPTLGGLYIDSAYYQPQTIAAPIIIHLGPQDLFWPCQPTGDQPLQQPLTPFLILHPCQTLPAPLYYRGAALRGSRHTHETQEQYSKQYGGENTSGNLCQVQVGSQWRRAWARSWGFDSENINKTRSNTSPACQNVHAGPQRLESEMDFADFKWTICTGTLICSNVCKYDIYYLYIWMYVSFELYINMLICVNTSKLTMSFKRKPKHISYISECK